MVVVNAHQLSKGPSKPLDGGWGGHTSQDRLEVCVYLFGGE